jgi:hypothetical protein
LPWRPLRASGIWQLFRPILGSGAFFGFETVIKASVQASWCNENVDEYAGKFT